MQTHPCRLALFLGAGVSRPVGFPLSAEILPLMLRRLDGGTLLTRDQPNDQGPELKRLLSQLLPALFEPGVDPPLITDLLSLVDQLLLDGHALGSELGPQSLDRLRALLDSALVEVLAEPPGEKHGAEELLNRLSGWIIDQAERLAVITTNYDLTIESRIYRRIPAHHVAREIDFGLSWRSANGKGPWPRPVKPRLGFFKLHGSLDWLRCAQCGHVTIDLQRGPSRAFEAGRGGRGGACVCGYRPLRHIFVAPSMVRELRDPNLLAVWHGALEALRTADEWVVIGYSLPPEDVSVRSLLLRAWRSRARPPRLRVIESSPDRELQSRYRLLFPGLSFEGGGVEGFVQSLTPQRRRRTGRAGIRRKRRR
jgi:hypothetical protein